jgi:NAD(P)-dependent dehydrogenase (short-subunit alcohol dehydrogenase family)
VSTGALDNKVIVIIGGTGGMGLSAARACVAAGAKLVAVGRDAADAAAAEKLLGPSALVITGDAVEPGTAVRAIDLAVERFGKLDGLYHVAGGSGRKAGDGPLHEISDEAWTFTLRLNLDSIFYSNRAAVRQLLKQGTGGSVLNMGSALGQSPSPRFFATHAYPAAKSAVIGFVKSCAAYYAPHDIRFNVIVPAVVETPMSQRAVGDQTIQKFIATKQPLDGGRVGRPDDLDAAVVYFLSDGSRFTTGQVLTVDGGWSVTEGQYPQPGGA